MQSNLDDEVFDHRNKIFQQPQPWLPARGFHFSTPKARVSRGYASRNATKEGACGPKSCFQINIYLRKHAMGKMNQRE